MIELDMDILVDKEVRLFLPSTEQSDLIFKLGDNIIGCVDSDLQRHYDYKMVGTFFEAESFYNEQYLAKIRWVDCGLFTVDRNFKLVNEDGKFYEIKSADSESELEIGRMIQVYDFEFNPFKSLT